MRIGFIGGGNMAEAIIASLLGKKISKASDISVSEPDPSRRSKLLQKYKIRAAASNEDLCRSVSVVLLAVKPQQMNAVLDDIRLTLTPRHLILSIAAGLDTSYFRKRLPRGVRVIRIMPNMCSMIGQGAAGLFAAPKTTAADRRLALKIFSASGTAAYVSQEDWLDAVTAISGSGPAFVFLFLEGWIQAARNLGLRKDLARRLVFKTFSGAIRMAEASSDPLPLLIQKVASKGGTTEAGLTILKSLPPLLNQTARAAAQRAKELRCTS